MHRLLDKAAKIIVWLNFTNLYTLLAGVTGLPFRVIGIGFIFALSAYIFLYRHVLQDVLIRKEFTLFLILFIVIPVLSTIIAPIFLISFVGYFVLAGLVFVTVVLWILKDGHENFCRWILASLVIGLIGIVMSYFQPSLFERVAFAQASASPGGVSEFENVRLSTAGSGRAFGFYMQPNRASFAIGFHLLVLGFVYFHAKVLPRLAMVGATLFAILLTGSRAGFVYVGLIVFLMFFFEFKNGIRIKGRIVSAINSVPLYVLFVVVAIGVTSAAAYADYQRNPERSAVMRVLNTFVLEEGESLAYDPSIEGRLIAQSYYRNGIARSPIWGHGLGASAYDRYFGSLYLSSHNNFLETAYSYGIPMTVLMYSYLAILAFSRKGRKMKTYFRLDFAVALLVYILAASMVTNIVFEYRVFPTVMGFFVGMLLYPQLRKDIRHQRPSFGPNG